MTHQEDWPLRGWLLTALGGAAGAALGLLMSRASGAPVDLGTSLPPLPLWRLALATFVFSAFVALALGLERRRWPWAVAAALALGALLGAIGWNTARYSGYGWSFEWPFAAAVVASLVLLPLFQTVRDEGAARLPPERVHGHVWADFVIGAVGVLFVGVVFLLVALIDQLLRLVGITLIEALWDTRWFGWALAGASFGAVAARLRERAGLLGTLLTVFFVVLAVLAPVLAVGIALFLGALPFGGLQSFWGATGSSTVILLACAVLSVWLVNAVIGGERGGGVGRRVLRVAALVLVLVVLPLGVIGAVGLGIRVDAFGWTPTRLWGVAAIAVTVAWGAAYLWTVVRRRGLDEGAIFAANVRLGMGVAAVALLLALPLVDFGSISTRSQLARLEAGRIAPGEFDWGALANEFGPAGRRALERIARTGSQAQRQAALQALDPQRFVQVQEKTLPQRIETRPAGAQAPAALLTAIAKSEVCRVGRCVVWRTADDEAVALGRGVFGGPGEQSARSPDGLYAAFVLDHAGKWKQVVASLGGGIDMEAAVTVRTVTRRQLIIGGKPMETFEQPGVVEPPPRR